MAEFGVVMAQAKRLCKSFVDCGDCPLLPLVDDNCHCPFNDRLDAEKVEAVIMEWAEEHPEPRYPSWDEVWKQWFPEAKEGKPPCVRYMLSKKQYEELCDRFEYCEECRRQPIPAYIAERLGIKPK